MGRLGVVEVTISDRSILSKANPDSIFSFDEAFKLSNEGDDDNNFMKDIHMMTPLFNFPQVLVDKSDALLLPSDEALLAAVLENDKDKLEMLLEMGYDINYKSVNSEATPLLLATAKGHYDIIKLLLDKGANPNIQGIDGNTALMTASSMGDEMSVKILLEKYPNVDVQGKDGKSALILASYRGHCQIATSLLFNSANYNLQDNDGRTALMGASCCGHYLIVENLLAIEQVLINAQDKYGMTALMLACNNEHYLIVDLLLTKNADINLQNNDGFTALMLTSTNDSHEILQLLLKERKLDINLQDNEGWTALMHASTGIETNFQLILADLNINLNLQNNIGRTILMLLSLTGQQKMTEDLLVKDLDPNIQDINGVTALMLACANLNDQIAMMLLTICYKRLNIDIQSKNGLTALMIACGNGQHVIVKMLLKMNANVHIQDKERWTALMFSSSYGHCDVVNLLLAVKELQIDIENDEGLSALMLASRNGHYQVVEDLMTKEANVNIQSNDGVSALMFASANGHNEVVDLLLRKHTHINLQERNNWTALMFASFYGQNTVVELLLTNGAEINVQNNEGMDTLTMVLLFTNQFIEYAFSNRDLQQLIHQRLPNYASILSNLLKANNQDVTFYWNYPVPLMPLAGFSGNLEAITTILDICRISSNDLASTFEAACANGHTSVMLYLSNKLPSLSITEQELLVAITNGDVETTVSKINTNRKSSNAPLINGLTPLMIAASCGHSDIVQILLLEGADINSTNSNGESVFDIIEGIKMYDRSDIKDLLVNHDTIETKSSIQTETTAKSTKNTNLTILNSIIETAKSSFEQKLQPILSFHQKTNQVGTSAEPNQNSAILSQEPQSSVIMTSSWSSYNKPLFNEDSDYIHYLQMREQKGKWQWDGIATTSNNSS